MADWNSPIIGTAYATVLTALKGRDTDAAGLCYSAPSNPFTGMMRYVRASNKFQEYNGASWDDKVLAVAGGGTGGATASDARTTLGIGTMGIQASNSVSITGGAISGLTSLGVSGNISTSGTIQTTSTAVDSIKTAGSITIVDAVLKRGSAGVLQVESNEFLISKSGTNIVCAIQSSDGYYAALQLYQAGHGSWLFYVPADSTEIRLYSGSDRLALTAAGALSWGGGSTIASSTNVSRVGHTHTKIEITDFPSIPTKVSDLTNDSGFITSAIGASLIPAANNTYDLGSDSYGFKDIYIKGQINTDPGDTTADDYPVVYSSGNHQLYHKTNGANGSFYITDGYLGTITITVQNGIVISIT